MTLINCLAVYLVTDDREGKQILTLRTVYFGEGSVRETQTNTKAN